MANYPLLSFLLLICILSYCSETFTAKRPKITIEEATVDDLQLAFKLKTLTSRQLVLFYLEKIRKLNKNLRGVIEVNPDALSQADIADKQRRECNHTLSKLHGIPILLKDTIATKDKLNTTAGSFALFGSIVPRDAGVVSKLRRSGAIILGKASLSEWCHFRSFLAPSGWSARGSQGMNPYNSLVEVCGSSSGSAISVAANMVSVTLGTETDGSIICPASFNPVVGIKPTVGLTSRAGVIPISPRQDTVGPICRTVADAVHVLDIIVGIDENDNATSEASKYIPVGGYGHFLKHNGLRGKRLGKVNMLFDSIKDDAFLKQTFEQHFTTLRKQGAVLVDNLEIANVETVLDSNSSGEFDAILAEFKIALNEYLTDLVKSPVKSLREVIEFNKNHSKVEKINEYGQDVFELAEKTSGMGPKEHEALSKLERLSKHGFKKLMADHSLDALVAYANSASTILAIGGFPGIVVPAGYHNTAMYPFGICFGGLKGSEPKLIEIAYAFEQATKIRRKPPLADDSQHQDNLVIATLAEMLSSSDETTALSVECKISLNAYLKELVASPVRSLADVIAFNNKHQIQENIKEYPQDELLEAEAINGFGKAEKKWS